MPGKPNPQQLVAENQDLRARLEKAEESLREVLSGEADALFVSGAGGAQLFTLKGADQSYRTLIENMSEGALTLTREGLVLYANRRCAAMLRTPLEKVIGSDIHTWVAPASRQILQTLLRKDAADNHHEELAFVAADGTQVPIYLSVSRLVLDAMPDSFCMVATDLTEQKRNESILAADTLARSILEQAADAIVICDESGRIIRASKEAHALYGEDPRGQPFAHAFPLRQLDGTAFTPIGAIETNRRQSAEASLERNGQQFDLLVSVGHLKGARNELLGSVVTLTDITERKRAEEETRQLAERLTTTLESITDALFTVDQAWRFTFINREAERLLARTREELLGRDIWVEFPPAIGSLFEREYRRAIEDNQSVEFEEFYPPLDTWFGVHAYPSTQGLAVYFRDIGARKRAEEVLRERVKLQGQLIQIAASVPGLIYSFQLSPDGSTRMPYVSVAFKEIFDVEPGDVIEDATPALSLIHPDDIEQVNESIAESARTMNAWRSEFRVCRTRLGEIWVEAHSVPLREPDGSILWTGFMHDITERKQAADALREAKHLLQLAVENMPARIFWKDRNLRYLGCNTRFAQDAGHSGPDELTGKTDFDMRWKDQAEMYHADDRAVLESGVPKLNIEEPQTTPNGNTIWLRTSKVPLRDKDNQIIGILGLYQDITHRKHAQDEVQRLSRFPEENPNPVLRIGRDGAILYANPVSTPILTTWGRVVGQNLSDAWRQLIAGTFESGLTKEVNIECDGRIFSCHLTPILAEDYVNVYGRDITEQQHAVEALRTSEAEFRTLAESMPQIVWITRPDGWNIYLNHQWMDYTGLTLEDSLGQGWNKPFHPDDQRPASEAWRRATLENGTYSIEARLRRADGVYRWWLVRGVPLQEVTGNVLKWFGTCTDIHDLKIAELAISRANEELRESERRFNDLLQHVELAAVMLDQEGHITYCNDYLLRLAGWRQEEVIGKNWFELFLPPEISNLKDAYYASLLSNQQEERHHENEILTRSGQRRLIHWNNSVLRSGAGEVIGTASIGEDITERKMAEEVLRLRASELERFHRLSVGRELQMIELKKQINDLAKQAGQEPPYDLAFLTSAPVKTNPGHE